MVSYTMLRLNDILRAGSVKRWHIVSTARDQTLAEHLFNVAMISRSFATKYQYPNVNIYSVMVSALYHDIEEVITGDIAAPIKREFQINYKVSNQLQHEMWPTIIKTADYLESIWFLTNFGAGSHAKMVLHDVKTNYNGWMSRWSEEHSRITKEVEAEIMCKEHVII